MFWKTMPIFSALKLPQFPRAHGLEVPVLNVPGPVGSMSL